MRGSSCCASASSAAGSGAAGSFASTVLSRVPNALGPSVPSALIVREIAGRAAASALLSASGAAL